MTTNEWHKARQLSGSDRLYVVRDPLGSDAALIRIENAAATLDHAKREIIGSRYCAGPQDAIGGLAPR